MRGASLPGLAAHHVYEQLMRRAPDCHFGVRRLDVSMQAEKAE